jgi:hypothetical protein
MRVFMVKRSITVLVTVTLALQLTLVMSTPAQAASSDFVDARPVVALDYSMPDRFGQDANGDGLMDYYTDPFTCTGDTVDTCDFRDHTAEQDIVPASWRVDIDSCGSTAPGTLATYTWKVVGAPAATVQSDGPGCDDYFVEFPDEGTYYVDLTISGALGTTTKRLEVVVQDWLVIGLGDSFLDLGQRATKESTPINVGSAPCLLTIEVADRTARLRENVERRGRGDRSRFAHGTILRSFAAACSTLERVNVT